MGCAASATSTAQAVDKYNESFLDAPSCCDTQVAIECNIAERERPQTDRGSVTDEPAAITLWLRRKSSVVMAQYENGINGDIDQFPVDNEAILNSASVRASNRAVKAWLARVPLPFQSSSDNPLSEGTAEEPRSLSSAASSRKSSMYVSPGSFHSWGVHMNSVPGSVRESVEEDDDDMASKWVSFNGDSLDVHPQLPPASVDRNATPPPPLPPPPVFVPSRSAYRLSKGRLNPDLLAQHSALVRLSEHPGGEAPYEPAKIIV